VTHVIIIVLQTSYFLFTVIYFAGDTTITKYPKHLESDTIDIEYSKCYYIILPININVVIIGLVQFNFDNSY